MEDFADIVPSKVQRNLLVDLLLYSVYGGYLLIVSQSIQDSDNADLIFKPFLLLGLLANYNKFEFRNPYRLRLEDFVNESAIQKIVQGIGSACSQSRNSYVAVQEDVAEGWTVGSTLAYIGLGVLAPSKGPAPAQAKTDDMKEGFATLYDMSINFPWAPDTEPFADQTLMPPSCWESTISRMPTKSSAPI